MTQFTTPTEGDESLISVEELAAWLGFSVHTVKRWAAAGPESGRVPRMLRVNGANRFRRQDVRDWLDSKEVR
jgi:predicted DNA-binding transcriptional regulator AlpA